MISLRLNSIEPGTSEFPVQPELYLCDLCGRDISRRLHHGRAHVNVPIGPPRFRCKCGKMHLSGACEWDHRSDWERKRRVGLLGLGVLASAPLLLTGALACLAYQRQSLLLLLVSIFLLVPSVALAIPAAISMIEIGQIVASIWRTRVWSNVFLSRTRS